MRFRLVLATGVLALTGCYVAPLPPPRERVVHREVVDQYGNVVERDTVVEDGPVPEARVEVIPVRPYPAAIWVRGYWFRDRYRHRWVWAPGHWR
jgi:hypothetical protein